MVIALLLGILALLSALCYQVYLLSLRHEPACFAQPCGAKPCHAQACQAEPAAIPPPSCQWQPLPPAPTFVAASPPASPVFTSVLEAAPTLKARPGRAALRAILKRRALQRKKGLDAV